VNQYASKGHMEPYTMKALADGSFLIAGRGTANGQGPYDGMVMHEDHTPAWRRYLRVVRTNPAGDVDDELAFHIQSTVDELVAQGMSYAAAREAAEKKFGDVERISATLYTLSQQRERTMDRQELLQTIKQDLIFGLRQLRKSPVFTLVAVLTLALGIGANSAIFSVVYSVLLNPLPYANGNRIVTLDESIGAGQGYNAVTLGNFDTWRKEARSFEALGAEWGTGSRTLTGVGDPTPIYTMQRTSGFWKAQFIPPVLGRYFQESDEQLNAPNVVVLSTALWKNRFNGDATIVGKTITLNAVPWMVVGIAPPDYILVPPAEMIWIPLVLPPERWNDHSDAMSDVAGLAHGRVGRAGVRDFRSTRACQGTRTKDSTARARTIAGGTLVGNQRRNSCRFAPWRCLLACGSVANLLGARNSAPRQMSRFVARSARRRRVIGQLLTKVFCSNGGRSWVCRAMAGVKFLVTGPAGIPRLQNATLNTPVLLFTFGLSVACALVFGLWPALRASRLDLQQTLRDGGRESAAGVRDRARGVLVVSELCLAQLLLVGAGLMIRSMLAVLSVPPGFATKNVLMMNVQLPSARYATATVREAVSRIREAVAAVPGVRAWLASGADSRATIQRAFPGAAAATTATGTRTCAPPIPPLQLIEFALRDQAFTTADAHGFTVAIINERWQNSMNSRSSGDALQLHRRLPGSPSGDKSSGVGDIHANGLSTTRRASSTRPRRGQSAQLRYVRANIDAPSLLDSPNGGGD
jgi:predicted permease